MTRSCENCGERPVRKNDGRYRFCEQCVPPEPPERDYLCEQCGTDISHRCVPARFCFPCAEQRAKESRVVNRYAPNNDNQKARAITRYAVRVGFLPPPTSFKCTDCGRPAECYDHRDYTKPLEVEPVCIRCNTSRGKGIPLHLNN